MEVSTPVELASNAEDRARLAHTLSGIDFCISHAETPEGTTIGSAVDHLGAASFCFLSMLLAAPFLQPMSLGPLTIASGGVFILVGWQMAKGREHLELPDKVRAWTVRGGGWVTILKFCRRLLLWLSKFTQPRLSGWVDGPRGSKNVGWLIFTGGVLLAIPCANLPFNNTLPALMIFFAGLAWLERDGLMAVISLAWGALTVIYFVITALLVFWLGASAWEMIAGWFGG